MRGFEQQRRRGSALDGKEKKEEIKVDEGEEEEGDSGGASVPCRDMEGSLRIETEGVEGAEGREGRAEADSPLEKNRDRDRDRGRGRDSLLDLLVACTSKLESAAEQSKSSRLMLP